MSVKDALSILTGGRVPASRDEIVPTADGETGQTSLANTTEKKSSPNIGMIGNGTSLALSILTGAAPAAEKMVSPKDPFQESNYLEFEDGTNITPLSRQEFEKEQAGREGAKGSFLPAITAIGRFQEGLGKTYQRTPEQDDEYQQRYVAGEAIAKNLGIDEKRVQYQGTNPIITPDLKKGLSGPDTENLFTYLSEKRRSSQVDAGKKIEAAGKQNLRYMELFSPYVEANLQDDIVKIQTEKPSIMNSLRTGNVQGAADEFVFDAVISGNEEAIQRALTVRDQLGEVAGEQQQQVKDEKVFGKELILNTAQMLPMMAKGAYYGAIPVVGPALSTSMWARQGAGEILADMEKDGIPRDISLPVALNAGLAYSLIESMQIGQIKNIDPIKKALNEPIKKKILFLVKEKGKDWVKENLEEIAQSLVQEGAIDFAKNKTGMEIDSKELIKKYRDTVIETFKQSAGPMGLLSAIGLGAGAIKIGFEGRKQVDANQTPAGTEQPGTNNVTPKKNVALNILTGKGSLAKSGTNEMGEVATGKALRDFSVKDEDFWKLPEEKINEIYPQLSEQEQDRIQKVGEDVREINVEKIKQKAASVERDEEEKGEILNVEYQPTEGQKRAGNYRKGHIQKEGLNISIENPAQSPREGTDRDGKSWKQVMQHDYGYILGTKGAEWYRNNESKDQVDVFINPGAETEGKPVFVIDQVDPKTGKFDEHKSMIGFDSAAEAQAAYLENYEPGWKGFGAITEMALPEFKEWVYSEATKEPVKNYVKSQKKLLKETGASGNMLEGTNNIESEVNQNGELQGPKRANQKTETVLSGESDPVAKTTDGTSTQMPRGEQVGAGATVAVEDDTYLIERMDDFLSKRPNSTRETGTQVYSSIKNSLKNNDINTAFYRLTNFKDQDGSRIAFQMLTGKNIPQTVEGTEKALVEHYGKEVIEKAKKEVLTAPAPVIRADQFKTTKLFHEKINDLIDRGYNKTYARSSGITRLYNSKLGRAVDVVSNGKYIKEKLSPDKFKRTLPKDQYTPEYEREAFLNKMHTGAADALKNGFRDSKGKAVSGGWSGWKKDLAIITDKEGGKNTGDLSDNARKYLQSIVDSYSTEDAQAEIAEKYNLDPPNEIDDVLTMIREGKSDTEFREYHTGYENDKKSGGGESDATDSEFALAEKVFNENPDKLSDRQREILETEWGMSIDEAAAAKDQQQETEEDLPFYARGKKGAENKTTFGYTVEESRIIYGSTAALQDADAKVRQQLTFIDTLFKDGKNEPIDDTDTRSSLRDTDRGSGTVYGMLTGVGGPFQSTVAGDWKKHRRIDLTGNKIHSFAGLAQLFAVYRHPRIEHFHIVYVDKSGKILAHNAISSGMIGVTHAFQHKDIARSTQKIHQRMKRLGASQFFIIHNHPSGNVQASTADIAVTDRYAFDYSLDENKEVVKTEVPEFGGHIILNHGKFGLLDRYGKWTEGVIDKSVSQKREASRMDNRWVVASYASSILNKDQQAAVIYIDSDMTAVAWEPISISKRRDEYGDHLALGNINHQQIFERGRKYGSERAIVVTNKEGVYTTLSKMLNGGFNADYRYSIVEAVLLAANDAKESIGFNRFQFLRSEKMREKSDAMGPGKSRFAFEEKREFEDQIYTPEFKKWFGDWENDPENASKVVDESGKPMVVYHGSPASNVTEFWPLARDVLNNEKTLPEVKEIVRKLQGQDRLGYMTFRAGTFFTPQKDFAEHYGENIYKVYLNARNPVRLYYEKGEHVSGTTDKKAKADAMFIYNDGELNEIAVLFPSQIKSASDNKGAFDSNNTDIRFSKGGQTSETSSTNTNRQEPAGGNIPDGNIDLPRATDERSQGIAGKLSEAIHKTAGIDYDQQNPKITILEPTEAQAKAVTGWLKSFTKKDVVWFETDQSLVDALGFSPDGISFPTGKGGELGNAIYLNVNSTRPMLWTAGHELWHFLEQNKEYKAQFWGAVKTTAKGRALIEKLQGEYKNKNVAESEFAADIVGEMVTSPEFWEVLQKQPSIFEKLMTKLIEILSRLSTSLRETLVGPSGQAAEYESLITNIEDVRNTLARILRDYHAKNKSGEVNDTAAETALAVGQMAGPKVDVDPVEMFYSPLLKAVRGLKQEKGTGEQFFNMLTKAPGVKEAEWKWMGLDDFLKGKKSVTRGEIEEFVRGNMVQVEEEYKFDNVDTNFYSPLTQEEQNRWQLLRNNFADWDYEKGGYSGERPLTPEEEAEKKSYEQRHNNALSNRKKKKGEKTKYSKYVLLGAQNYREVLMTLPSKTETDGLNWVNDGKGNTETTDSKGNEWIISEDGNTYAIYKNGSGYEYIGTLINSLEKAKQVVASAIGLPSNFKNYASSHWDEPNVFAHTRLDDRIGPDGERVLFVEEIQSDWEREAREKGVEGANEPTVKQYGISIGDNEPNLFFNTRGEAESRIETIRDNFDEPLAIVEVDRVVHSGAKKRGVPNQPFLKNWQEVVLKRILRLAAEEGYDRVAWISGQQTADRYDLSKQVEYVLYSPDGLLTVVGKNDNELLNKKVNENEIADYIGKEPARRLLESPKDYFGIRRISGENLKIGGEWAFNLYDKMIPQFLNKYGKKWGAQVESVPLGDYYTKVTLEEYEDRYGKRDLFPATRKEYERRGVLLNLKTGALDVFPENVDADKYLAKINNQGNDVGLQQSIKITPVMKDAVLYEGQPLFARSPKLGTKDDIQKAKADIIAEKEAIATMEREANKLKGKLLALPEERLLERAEINVKIKGFKLEELEQIKTLILDYARKIGIDGVGFNKVAAQVAASKSVRGLERAIRIMDQVWEGARRVEAITALEMVLEKEYRRMSKIASGKLKSTIAPEYNITLKRYLDELTSNPEGSEFDYKGWVDKMLTYYNTYAQKDIRQAESLQGLPDEIVEWMEDPSKPVPDKISKAIKYLFRHSISTMTTDQIEKILNDIESIKATGRTVRMAEELARQEELNRRASAGAEVIKQATKGDPNSEQNAIDAVEKRKLGRWEWMGRKAEKGLWSLIDSERMVEWLSGFKNVEVLKSNILNPLYAAEKTKTDNMKASQAVFDKLYKDLDMKELYQKPYLTVDLKQMYAQNELTYSGKKSELSLTLNQMMFIYANSHNPGNRAHVLGMFKAESVGEAFLEKVISALPDNFKNIVDAQIHHYDNVQYYRMNNVFQEEHEVPLPKEEKYFPIQNVKTDRAESAVVADYLARYSSRWAGVQKGMTKMRVHSKAPFRQMDYIGTVVKNMLQTEHYIAYTIPVRNVQQYLNHKDIRMAIENKNPEVYSQLKDWLKAVAYGRVGGSENVLDQFVDFMRNNFSTFALGLRLTTAMQQFASLPRGMALLDKKSNLMKSAVYFMKDAPAAMKFAARKSALMAARESSYERELAEMYEKGAVKKYTGLSTVTDKVKEWSMWHIGMTDRIVATVLWQARYQEGLDKGLTDVEAVSIADELIRKTQSRGGVLYMPALYRGSGIARAFLMFSSDLNQSANLLFELAGKWKMQKTPENLTQIMLMFAVPTVIIYIVNSALRFDEPEDYVTEFVHQFAGAVPYFGILIDAVTKSLMDDAKSARGLIPDKTWQQYAADLTPAPLQLFETLSEGLAKRKPEKLAQSAAQVFGIPYSAPKQMITGTAKFVTGDVPDWRSILWGKRKALANTVYLSMAKRIYSPRPKSDDSEVYSRWYNSLNNFEKDKFREYLRNEYLPAKQKQEELKLKRSMNEAKR